MGFSPSHSEHIEKIFIEKRQDVSVTFAASEDDALPIIKEGEVAAVLINHAGKQIDGFSFVANLNALGYHVPTVFITAAGDREAVLKAFAQGIYECLPMDSRYIESLPSALDLALARHQYKKSVSAKEWAITQSRQEWLSIIDAITDFIFITDDQCKLLKMNRAFSSIFGGAHPRSLIGSTCVEVFGSDAPCIGCQQNSLRERTPYTIETKVNDNLYQLSTFPLFIDDKSFTIHVMKDVTEMRKLKDRLYYSDKLASLGSLVAGVAHEINNPLTGIIAYTELLRMKAPAAGVDTELKKILHNAERCKKIVENLLTFSRQKAPTRSIESLNDIIDRTLDLRTYWLRSGNIEIIREYGEGVAIFVDAQQIQLVILNILLNAEQAITDTKRGKGMISVSTKYDVTARRVKIRFTDNGTGIPRDVIPKVFDPFFTTKPIGTGTGLGLAISHGIITEHGGSIWLESTEGEGTTVILDIPTGVNTVPLPRVTQEPGNSEKKER